MLQALGFLSKCCFKSQFGLTSQSFFLLRVTGYCVWCNDITSEHDNWHRSSHWPSALSALLTGQPIIRAHRQLFKVLPCHLPSLMKMNWTVDIWYKMTLGSAEVWHQVLKRCTHALRIFKCPLWFDNKENPSMIHYDIYSTWTCANKPTNQPTNKPREVQGLAFTRGTIMKTIM